MHFTLTLMTLLITASLEAFAETTYGPAPTTNQGQAVPRDVVIPSKVDPCATKKPEAKTSNNPNDNKPREFGAKQPAQQDSRDQDDQDKDKDCPKK